MRFLDAIGLAYFWEKIKDWVFMNDKEKELWRVIDNVIKCCAIELQNGELSITREDVLGKSRAENLVMQNVWSLSR